MVLPAPSDIDRTLFRQPLLSCPAAITVTVKLQVKGTADSGSVVVGRQ
jgi:hypothetical protein